MRDQMLELVKDKHSRQTRNGRLKTPYWHHCENAARIIAEAVAAQGEIDDPLAAENLYLAALGHDLYEDTDVVRADIAALYGPAVHRLISAMTNDGSDQDRAGYLEKLRNASDEVLLIKYADLIDNVESVVANRDQFEPGDVASIMDIFTDIHPVLAAHRFGPEWAVAAATLRDRLAPAWTELLE
jgi:(p)ppGpp synthase/HD superfamily hydrolase